MTDADEVRLELPRDLGMEQVEPLRARLAPRLDAPAVVLSGAAVARLHAASLQLLAAFVATRAAGGRATRWQDFSPELRAAVARLGLDPVLGLAGPARSQEQS